RRPQDVEVLRQRHQPLRSARGHPQEVHGDVHRPAAPAPQRPRPPRGVQPLRVPPPALAARAAGAGGPRVPGRRHRLRRRQAAPGGGDHRRLGADAEAPRGGDRRPRHPLRHPRRGVAQGPRAGGRNDGAGAQRDVDGLRKAARPGRAPGGEPMSRPDRPRTPEPEGGGLLPESWRVHLPVFDGPLDLLLHLCKINEVEITDIPVATICDQFHAYLTLMEELNLDIAGEYIYEAALLILLKSKMLLPRPAAAAGEPEEDPRQDLVLRLLEYRRLKEVAQSFAETDRLRLGIFTR